MMKIIPVNQHHSQVQSQPELFLRQQGGSPKRSVEDRWGGVRNLFVDCRCSRYEENSKGKINMEMFLA